MKKSIISIALTILLAVSGCGNTTAAGYTSAPSEQTSAAEPDASQPQAAETDPAESKTLSATAIDLISNHLSKAARSADAAESGLKEAALNENILEMALEGRDAAESLLQAGEEIRKAAERTEGVNELEAFRSEIQKAYDLIPQDPSIGSKEEIEKLLEDTSEFKNQLDIALEEWEKYKTSIGR